MTEHDVPQPPTGIGRRGFLAGAAGLGLTAAGTTLAGPATADTADPDERERRGSFVGVEGRRFVLDGTTFRFGGTNTYYLHQQSHHLIDTTTARHPSALLRTLHAHPSP